MGLPDFSGETGGLLATMWIVGVAAGWGLCVKIRVQPLREHAIKIETKLDELLTKIETHFWEKR
jgi:hypothetical protein